MHCLVLLTPVLDTDEYYVLYQLNKDGTLF